MDRLTSLTVFTRVVESGGFSAAARRLHMSATMVSNHVLALEDQLGVRLLNRTTRKISLTEIGRTYYERTTHILADLDEADRIASELQATPRGTLKLYASLNMARLLAPVIAEYLAKYPAASVEFLTGERMVDMIEDGFDLVIHGLEPPGSGLIRRKLMAWRPVLCCSPAYLERHPLPVTIGDLAQHNCLRYAHHPHANEWRFEGPGGKIVSVHISGNFATGSVEALRILAVEGRGIYCAPGFSVMEDIANGRLVTLLPGERPEENVISAIYPSKHNLSSKVRSFIDLLAVRIDASRDWTGSLGSDEGCPGAIVPLETSWPLKTVETTRAPALSTQG